MKGFSDSDWDLQVVANQFMQPQAGDGHPRCFSGVLYVIARNPMSKACQLVT